MAGDLSTVGEALVRRWMFTAEAVERPGGWFLALYTAPPTDEGGGVELAGVGYARQAIIFDPEGAMNTNTVRFQAAGGDFGTITHGAIFDEASGGRFLAWADLAAAKTIPDGDALEFQAGDIVVEFD